MPAPRTKAEGLLELIGRTPVIHLRRISEDGCAQLWGKCEHFNPGGSIKDRIALAMIEAAERDGNIVPGESVVVEPTSGNTGIGLALVCAAKGYRLILTMPEDMSLERRQLLQSYGAEIVLTPENRVMEGAVARARELCEANANYFMPDQFSNPANPEVHRRTTGPEIVQQFQGHELSAFVSAIGTGGTITGVGGVLREAVPGCKIVGVEPARSAVLSGDRPGPHKIQGIGAGFVPKVLNREVMHDLRTVIDRDAYEMSRRLAREEGLLVGISSGANVHIAREVARDLGPECVVLTVLCDTGERYFSLNQYFG
jgi:cysteine synthase A